MSFSGPLYDCAEGEMKCVTRKVFLDSNNQVQRGLTSSYDGKLHGWPCIPQESYNDGKSTDERVADCLDLSDESK